MKNFILLLAFLSMATLSYAAEFKDSKYRYSLQFPDSWSLQSRADTDGFIRADIFMGKKAGLQIRIYENRSESFQRFTDSYVHKFIDDMRSRWRSDIKEINREFGFIGQNYGCTVIIESRRKNGQEWVFKEYLIKRDAFYLAFQSGVQKDLRSVYEPVFDEIVTSLSFK